MTVEKFLREAEVWGYHLEGDNVMVARLIQIIRRQQEALKEIAAIQLGYRVEGRFGDDPFKKICDLALRNPAKEALSDCDRIAGSGQENTIGGEK